MTAAPESFIDYWDAVDAAMLNLFGIDTLDADIDVDWIAGAQEEACTPEDFARWLGAQCGLKTLAGGNTEGLPP